MRLQVLVAAMQQTDHSLLEEMNIQSDVIVGNQCDRNSVEEFEWNSYHVKYLNFAERGVGLNRNNTLMRATGDICLFADDDIVYYDGYSRMVTDAFREIPDADLIIFNNNLVKDGKEYPKFNHKTKRLRLIHALKYGTYVIAIRNDAVRKENLNFSRIFGGGSLYGSGEDSLFLLDCFRAGLKVYTHSAVIAKNMCKESTWFRGFNDKYFYDKGAWIACAFPRAKHFIKWYFILRYHQKSGVGIPAIRKMVNHGIAGSKQLIGYHDYVSGLCMQMVKN